MQTEVHKRFSAIVQQTWDASNLNQSNFADLLGVSRASVISWVKGTIENPLDISVSALRSLAAVRHQSLDELIAEIEGDGTEKKTVARIDLFAQSAPVDEFFVNAIKLMVDRLAVCHRIYPVVETKMEATLLGHMLGFALEKSDLTPEEFAEKSGLPIDVVQQILTSKDLPILNSRDFKAIAEALPYCNHSASGIAVLYEQSIGGVVDFHTTESL